MRLVRPLLPPGQTGLLRLPLDAVVDPKVETKTGVTALDIAREFKNEAAIAVLLVEPASKP